MQFPISAAALEGVRVLDISNLLAAPMSAMFLADFGAEVIKVERPSRGDELRFWGENKDGVGLYFKVINRNKKSVTLDLHTPIGVEAVKKLVEDIDIIVENYRPGTLEKWGLGYDVLSAINPRLIMLRISGFGQTGPYSHRPGFGTLAEAMAGYAQVTGEADGPPMLPGFGLADATTGLMAAFLSVTALHAQRKTGRGQVIDLAIYETLMTLIGPHVVNYDQLGLIQHRQGSRLPFVSPRNLYRTRDRQYVSIAGSSQSIFERICRALDAEEIVSDPRFADNRKRLQHVDALEEAIADAVAKHDLASLLERFEAHQAAISPVYDVQDMFHDRHMLARENIVGIPDPELGNIRMQNVVGKLSATPGRIGSAGPVLGSANREILVDRLQYTPEELARQGITLEVDNVAAS